MAFVVEDGTGIEDANAYTSVAYYRAYFTDRGRDVSLQTDDQIKGWIVRATDYVEKRFGTSYKGDRATLIQALGFPREGVVVDGVELVSDAIPTMFQNAICEYAYRAGQYDELAPDTPVPFARLDADGNEISGSGIVTFKSEKVDVIEEKTAYANPAELSTTWAIPAYPAADMMLANFLTGRTQGRTIRA